MGKQVNFAVLQDAALRHFMEVVHTGSVTEAASRLGVAPSAVSRHIARLESALDTLLFDRRARGMELNAAGELLATHARRAWQDIQRVSEDIRALRGLRSGAVRVAVTKSLAMEFMPRAIAAFQHTYVGIRFNLTVLDQSEVPKHVREGQADIGVTVGTLSERGIHVELRHPSPIVAVMSSRHPLSTLRQLTLEQLVAQPIALPGKDSTLRRLLEISCSRQNLLLEATFECNWLAPCLAYVEANQAITFSGELAVRGRLKRGDIVGIPLLDREMNERHFELQTLAGRHLPSSVSAFVRHMRAFLEEDAGKLDGNGTSPRP